MRFWAIPLALVLVHTGCDDVLSLEEEPKSFATTGNFYRNAADARAAIAATYRPLSDGNLFSTSLQWALIGASDIARIGPEEENINIINLTRMSWDTRTPYTRNPWSGFYDIITRANLLLEKLPGITMDETQKAQLGGEAKFLRALSYFYLVRLYGDVPLVTTTAEQLNENLARTPKEQVFQQILKDAREAEAALPLRWSAGDKGRAPKGAAQALLADVHLWRSTAENQNEWQQAADAAKRLIDSNVYALVPDYINAFLPGSQNRSEEIFAAQASSATGAPGISTAVWFYPRILNPNQAGGWATMVPLQWHLDSYPPNDYRKDVSYFTSAPDITGTVRTFAPHVFKYRPTTRPGPQDVNWPIYRYADVLLMYAEALNELGRSEEAVRHVNMVRARARNNAGTPRAQPADLPVMGRAALRDAIYEERRWELAFEGKRWFDLVRRGPDFFLAQLAKDPTATDAQPSDMLWPIPQAEIDLNPNLTQNPGY